MREHLGSAARQPPGSGSVGCVAHPSSENVPETLTPEQREELLRDLTGPSEESERKRLSFIRMLNNRLPTKRVIGQGLLRSTDGRVLLCQLTYKRDWDLPGGVVDPGESPATCVVREVREELGLEVSVRGMLAVNWLAPYRGWDDALLCLFDLGTVDASITDEAKLLRREIRAVHWVEPDRLADHIAPYTAAMLAEVLGDASVVGGARTAYIEDSRRVDFGD